MDESSSIDSHEAASPTGASPVHLRAFYGHHKCATGWISNIVREICFHMGVHFRVVHDAEDEEVRGPLDAFVEREGIDLLAYTNADIEHARLLPPHRGFHVVRDPRDVLVSAYFSHRYSHPTDPWPELRAHRETLRQLSKKDGLFEEMEFSRQFFDQMHRWDYNQEHVMEIKLEALSARPRETFREITAFLGFLDEEGTTDAAGWLGTAQMHLNRLNERGRRFMPARLPVFPVPKRRLHGITPGMLETILQRKSFKRMAGGREKGEENVKSHYRKGEPGDWKNHLDQEHIARFKDEYNDLLLKLGYETTPDW